MTTMRIQVFPDPPHAGLPVTICYDFPPEPPPTSVALDVEWEPPTGSATYILDRDDRCVTLTVPTNAESLKVDDTSYTSPTYLSEVMNP